MLRATINLSRSSCFHEEPIKLHLHKKLSARILRLRVMKFEISLCRNLKCVIN